MISLSIQSFSQSHLMLFGGGIKPEALRDKGYSPLLYSGLGFEGFLGYQKSKDGKETIWLFKLSTGNLSNEFNRSLRTKSAGLINFNFNNRNNTENCFQWGWSNNNGFQNRNIDDFLNFNGRSDYFTSFGPSLKYASHFELKQSNFSFQTFSHVQILGFYLLSGYVSSLPGGFGYEQNSVFASFLKSAYLFYPGSAWNFGLWSKLEWHLRTGNSLVLNYLYEYTRFNKPHVSERSTGSWILTFNMLLKNE
jgi:hypothetical protein